MCLLLVAFDAHPDYQLIVAANRDEFHDRPADPAAFWPDRPDILGGRDRQGGGTWLAVNRSGAFAAITNVRIPGAITSPRSRGLIINDYLTGRTAPGAFVKSLDAAGHRYNGFNIIAANPTELAWYSNHTNSSKRLAPGVYGLSNHLLDTPWPKVIRLKHAFAKLLSSTQSELAAALFSALASEHIAPDPELPDTGLDLEYERVLSPIFINGERYGTRCSTLVLMTPSGHVTFIERRFGPGKQVLGEQTFEFEIAAAAT